MEIVYVGDRNASNRALLIPKKEWKRLGKILTKKMDKEDALEASERLREMRRQKSKKMVKGWNNTELNKTRKILEQKRKAFLELETNQKQRDEEMKREAQEARNRVIEKAQKLKFEEMDATKMFHRALRHSEVFRERAIQLKFNEDKRKRKIEKDLEAARKQRLEAEQYRKDMMDERQKNEELKRARAEKLLKELKDREDKRHNEEIAFHESGKKIMQGITEEIEQARIKTIAEEQAVKKKLQKHVEENQEMIARNKGMRQAEELEEDMVTSIMAETKKTLARARRLKELELMEIKQAALDEIRTKVAAWPVKDIGWAESDVQTAIKAKEQQYRDDCNKKRELANKRLKQLKIDKNLWEKEMAREQEKLNRGHKLEIERRLREKELLKTFAELQITAQKEKANKFREQLDKQCNEKSAAFEADREADNDCYKMFEQQCHNEDKEFMAYAGNIIEKKKLASDPVVPLLKTVKGYLNKNNLNINQDYKVSKKISKGSVYTSRIIRYVD